MSPENEPAPSPEEEPVLQAILLLCLLQSGTVNKTQQNIPCYNEEHSVNYMKRGMKFQQEALATGFTKKSWVSTSTLKGLLSSG